MVQIRFPKTGVDRYRRRPGLHDRQPAQRPSGHVVEHDGHAVAGPYTVRDEHVGQPVSLSVHLREAEPPVGAAQVFTVAVPFAGGPNQVDDRCPARVGTGVRRQDEVAHTWSPSLPRPMYQMVITTVAAYR